jgi:hypothetical protein
MESKDELRYQILRSLCDREHYLEPFDYGSIELVERLINDLITLKKRLKKFKDDILESNNRNDYLIVGINAYKIQNKELFRENNQLHSEILSLTNKLSYQGKDIEFNKLKDDKSSLHFLLSQANKKIEILYHQLSESKKKYIELIQNLYKRNVDSPRMLDEIVREYKVKLDPNIFDYDKYEKELELELKYLNNATDNYNFTTTTTNNNNGNGNDNNNYTNLEEKCRNLEMQLKNKDKEIELLKKNMYGDNHIEQRVVIDYLKEKLKNERFKYENYINYTIRENKLLNKKNEDIINERIKSRKRLLSSKPNSIKINNNKDTKKNKYMSTSIGKNKTNITKTTKKYYNNYLE